MKYFFYHLSLIVYMIFCFFYLYIYNVSLFIYFPFFLGTISRIWNETWLSSFFYKPCNYELFVKQSLNMEMAIVMARVWKIVFSCISFLPFFFLLVCPELIFLNIVSCILKHQDAGMDWIIHLDTDELLHPAGAREYSLRQLLLDVLGNVDKGGYIS